MMTNQKTPLLYVLLALAATLPGIAALGGPFFQIDDITMIHKSPYVADGPIARPLWEAFTTPRFSHFAPLHEVLIFAQWRMFGDNALGFRIVSLLLHAGAALACFRLLKALTQRQTLAFAVAMLWAAHPVHAEAVAWIVEQKTLWCGLFTLWALSVYMNPEAGRMRIAASTVLMALACMGKAAGIVVAPLAVLYEIFNPHGDKRPLPRRLLATLPAWAVLIVFTKLALSAHHHMDSIGTWGIRDIVLSLPASLLIYLQTAFLPWHASFFHDLDHITSAADPAFFGALLLLLAVAAGMWFLSPQRRLSVFCALAWPAAIGPMLSISMWTYPAYDRFQYMGLPFLLLGAALALEGLVARVHRSDADTPAPSASPMSTIWLVALLALSALALGRGGLFNNELTVFGDAVTKAPRSAYPHAAMANGLFPEWHKAAQENRVKEQQELAATIGAAAENARRCWNFRDFHPMPAHVLLAAAEALTQSGMHEPAEGFLQEVLDTPQWSRFKPQRAAAREMLAKVKVELAANRLRAARGMDPRTPASREHAQNALTLIRESRELRPPLDESFLVEHDVHRLLALIAKASEQNDDAVRHVQSARAALEALPTTSRFYEKAREMLKVTSDK